MNEQMSQIRYQYEYIFTSDTDDFKNLLDNLGQQGFAVSHFEFLFLPSEGKQKLYFFCLLCRPYTTDV